METAIAMTDDEKLEALEKEQRILQLMAENSALRKNIIPFSVIMKGGVIQAFLSAAAVVLTLKGCF